MAETTTAFPKHFDGSRYFNPDAPQAPGYLKSLRWKLTSRPKPSPRFVNDVEQTLPPRRVDTNDLRVTLVNHSTVIIQQRGANILTDPIWSDRAGPASWLGPKRHRMPGVALEDLPPIDAVVISHNHYDHLDLPTLRRLMSRGDTTFIVPTGVAALLRSHNIGPVQEMDWGESSVHPGFTVHSVPALHFSARSLFDTRKTLWCGYVIECQGRFIYFAGDTAFGAHFAQIREAFGPIRLALLPIGAYQPRWFMSPVHMSPEEAVRAHDILGAGTSIAIHHGTFQLADEALDTPQKDLFACQPQGQFIVLNNGQSANLA